MLPRDAIPTTPVFAVGASAPPFVPRFRALTLIRSVLIALIAARNANSIQDGTGDVSHSTIAVSIPEAVTASPERWASDDTRTGALILASGAPQPSGQHFGGPDPADWHALDPDKVQKSVWNRGAPHVTFAWDDGDEAAVGNPSPNTVTILIDRC